MIILSRKKILKYLGACGLTVTLFHIGALSSAQEPEIPTTAQAPEMPATEKPVESLPGAVVPGISESPEFIDLAKDLRCPTCTGLSVLDSDAPFSVQIKNEVKDQMKQGKTEAEIMAFFTERYGPWILREPPKSGANLLAWIIPGAMLIVGPFLIWLFVWRRRKIFSNYGVRTSDEILGEFEASLVAHRSASGAGASGGGVSGGGASI